ncbi:MAG: SgcJ/EcaC family oxidoreductase [Bacteroidia bacterium]
MRTFNFFSLLSLCLLAIACQPTTPKIDWQTIKTDIQALEDQYAEAIKAGDNDAIANLYTEDAMQMPNNQPMVKGRAAILAALNAEGGEAEDNGETPPTFEAIEVMGDGDMVIEVGISKSMRADGTANMGKYIAIWKKQADGSYRIYRDIFNQDEDYEYPSGHEELGGHEGHAHD